MTTVYTVHGVLAGALRGKRLKLDSMLWHASVDGGENALCKRVKEGHLADEHGTPLEQTVTCPACLAKVACL